MNDQEINIAIAEACCWALSEYGWWSHPALPDNGGAMPEPPNYCNDLNAMHEAENWLRTQGVLWVDYENRITKCATATQRAEAFLQTIGKWKEAK